MARRLLRILAVATLVAALCAAGSVQASAQSEKASTPTPNVIQQALQQLVDLLELTAADITGATAALEAANLVEQELQSICASSPIGALTVNMATFVAQLGLTGMPAVGEQLNDEQCGQLSVAAQTQSATSQASLSVNSNKYQQEESAVSEMLQVLNSLTSSFDQLAVRIGGILEHARAAEPRTLLVSAHGQRLRSLRIYFDKRLVASGHNQRLKARIAWRHAKPGLHRVRVVAIEANGHRLRRHIWLLRHDDRIARLIRRTK